MLNKDYGNHSNFTEAAARAGIKPTPRQFSKFMRGKGAAFKIGIRLTPGVHIPPQAHA